MHINTIDEQVQHIMLKYLYDVADDFTCMRLMMELLPIVGERAGLLVLAESKTDSLEVSFTNNTTGLLNKFILANGQVKDKTKE